MENNDEEILEIKTKLINGVEVSNLEIAKIGMIYDYLVLDRFQDYCTFFRLEKCFGPFFSQEPMEFLPEAFKEICGEKRKYISYGRLILAYTKWKSKSSKNEYFNKFMDEVFNNIIETQDKTIGKIVENGRIFSTRNNRGRKVISKFSVITDESKNKINGFHIQYDDVFDTILSPDKTKDNITLEMNFPPNGRNIRDRDGISHIGGKYSITKGIIKFLVFKCRSGKTFYIGDETVDDDENIKCFLYGTSSCQLKSVRIELVNGELIYLEPKFQPSLRVNQKIIDFDSIDDNYINKDIINGPLIFEENEIQNMSIEELEKLNSLIIPCINDDAFIDKKELEEPIYGKNFTEIYKSFLANIKEAEEKEVEELKNKIYEKTIMRKHLLRIYLRKLKVKENISVLRTNKQSERKISQDKFLAKIKAYRKKIDKNIEEKKEELKKEENDENNSYWDDEGENDWPKDESIEIMEIKNEEPKKEIKIEIPVEEIKIEEEKDKIAIEVNKEEKLEKEEPVEQEKVALRGKTKRILKSKIDNIKKEKEKKEELEEPKKNEEIIINEIIINEEPKTEEPKIEEIKITEKNEEDNKKESNKKEEKKESFPKDEIIIEEIKENSNNININTAGGDKEEQKVEKEEQTKKCFCKIF